MKNCKHNRAWYPVIVLDDKSSTSSSSTPEMANNNDNNTIIDNLLTSPSTSHEPCERRTSRSKSRGRSRSRSQSYHIIDEWGEGRQIRRGRHSRSRSRSRSRSWGCRMEKKSHHEHFRGEKRCHLSGIGRHHEGERGHHNHHGHHGRHIYRFMKKSKGHHHRHRRHHGSRLMPHSFQHEAKCNHDHCRAFKRPINRVGPSQELLTRTFAEVLKELNKR